MSELNSAGTTVKLSAFEQGEGLNQLTNPIFDVLRHHFEISAGYSVQGVNIHEPDDEVILSMGLSMVHRASGMKVFKQVDDSIKEHLLDDISGGMNMEDADDWKALTSIKKSAEENTTILHFIAITLLAAEHLPDTGYNGDRVPKPSKGRESTSHKIFRTSIEFLRRQATGGRISKEEKIGLMTLGLLDKESFQGIATSDTELGKQARKSMAKLAAATMARDILASFQVHSPQQIQDDLNRTYRAMMGRYGLEIPMDETGWEILPVEEIEATGVGIGDEDEDFNRKKFVDWARIKRLRDHVHNWPGAYIAVASLESRGDAEYYVAVLPAKIGQLAVEHAIGDNPSSGNAIYAWRAEKGLDDGHLTMTWRGVYKHTKRMARALGARRMLHTENIDWNILDYLTRPSDKLDEPGYSKPF